MKVYPSAERYRRKAILHVGVNFNRNTEPDLVEKIESVENRSAYIKGLIRDDLDVGHDTPGARGDDEKGGHGG